MSIHFITGKPGGGKTLYSVRLIIDEVKHGNRVVVTNVPLLLPRLNEYLASSNGHKFDDGCDFDAQVRGEISRHITERVILLNEDELPKFFCFRAAGVRLESVTNEQWRQGKRPDFSKVKDHGVLYVLDEVHIAFNSRAWADTGNEVLYYLSQHRKLGDDVICITQAIGNVDKQFRSVAQDFTYIKNLKKQRAGMFRLPSIFLRSTFAQPATDNSKAMETGSFTLDVTGMASCYDTARGVGIHGRAGADTKSRLKGLHWAWFVIAFPLAIFLIVHYSPKLLLHVLSPGKTLPRPVATNSVTVNQHADTVAAADKALDSSSGSRFIPRRFAHDTNEIFCTGYTVIHGSPQAYLSDGRTIYEDDGLTQIQQHCIWFNGEKIPIRMGKVFSDAYVPYVSPPQILSSPDRPINDAEVTVIGQNYRNRTYSPKLGSFSSMSKSSPGWNSPSASQ